MFLIFDTETTGLPKDYNKAVTDSANWPRLVQLAWQLHDKDGKLISSKNLIVQPVGFSIPFNSVKIHGITTERAQEDGIPLAEVLAQFEQDRLRAKYAVGHNVEFDVNIVSAEHHRLGQPFPLLDMDQLDTKELATDYCAIPGGRGGRFKWPRLDELHTKLFGEGFDDAHDAAYDVDATGRCFFALLQRHIFEIAEIKHPEAIVYEAPKLAEANFAKADSIKPKGGTDLKKAKKADISELEDLPFVHLHCHTQFSILQAASSVKELIDKAKSLNMPAIAFSDHGNMMAAYQFVEQAIIEDITPIVGCEFNICEDLNDKSRKDNGAQVVLLAKNKNGYHNLAKMSSIAFTEGFYYVPRIDKATLATYKDDLIATTGGIWGEVPNLILNVGETQAEEAFLWWKAQFGANFYVELNRHGLPEEDVVNTALLAFAKKHGVKYFAANNTYYTDKSDAKTHDILLCVRDAESIHKPKKYIGRRGREYRFGFPNEEFYVKTPEEMKKLFHDLPEAIATTAEIAAQIERYELAREVLLPKFEIPSDFVDPLDADDGGKRGENARLRHLAYEGAAKRYSEITDEIRERLDFELETIANSGYPGYFLIVEDFCRVARQKGVSVGPGRGSAAGSVVAYCVGITNVDPIKYDLLFERFLNPDRVSLPDIDIDFDDEGRQTIIDYVIEKYGTNQVSQIITYGKMAAKSAVRDAGRVLELPLSDTDRLAKLIPPTTFEDLLEMKDADMKAKFRDNEYANALELLKVMNGTGLEAEVIKQAVAIEGSVRNTGIHACGIIITPDDITKYVPVARAKDGDMWCTQFDNYVVEYAGLLKMDFLGLKTLTLIKDAVAIVKDRYGVEIIPDDIPLDDKKTYELFQRGETVGVFQYESAGMQAYLKDLKPTEFGDLIAMNALFRPGPIEYIPSFIRRKHGQEEITYDLAESEEYLKETYGVTVYQEQVMRLSQKLASFTKGEADLLRKAMGKKNFALLDQLKPKFLDGCEANGHERKIAEKIWKDWEAFASYAFNKSHSTCYALVAFHTAYLKANYPAAYMASVLSNNMSDIKQVSFFMEECRRLETLVLGPDVNESNLKFTVNDENQIRFGLGAIKGVGEAAVCAIVEEREKNGAFTDVYDFVSRTDKHFANKRCIEGLALAGALDCFENIHRSQYFAEMPNGGNFAETIVKFGGAVQTAKDAPPDLFGGSVEVEVSQPQPPQAEPWRSMERLAKEKEVVGIYISAHPLDAYKLEIDQFSKGDLRVLNRLDEFVNNELALAGMVGNIEHRTTKNGKPFGTFVLEDFFETHKFFLFSEDYLRMKHFLVPGAFLFIKGKIQPKPWTKTNEMEFKIHSIELLSELREKLTKKVVIEMEIKNLNDSMLADLNQIVGKKKQSKVFPVEFRVLDNMRKMAIKMPSRSKKIDLSDETISELNAIDDLKYKLNA